MLLSHSTETTWGVRDREKLRNDARGNAHLEDEKKDSNGRMQCLGN
jgi:hypothetical protein